MKATDMKAAKTLKARKGLTISANTVVEVEEGKATLYLFGNPIASYDGKVLSIRPTKWSYTTRMRLNAVAFVFGVEWRAWQADFTPFVRFKGGTIEDPRASDEYVFEV